jgi:hypothetical protein
MSAGTDRRARSGSLLSAVIVVLAVAAAAAGAYVWYRTSGAPVPSGPVVRIPVRFDEPLSVTLDLPGGGALSPKTASVKRQPDTQGQAQEVLNALLSDPRAAQSPVLASLRLRAFYLDSDGTAFVDVMPQSPTGVKASAWDELLGLYAFVDTLTGNFEEIKRVRFLLDGREAQTLAGHIDMERTLTKRSDLVKQ